MAGNVMAVTDADFETTILKADKPALIDFWAVWCGPCKAVAPVVEELASEFEGRAVVAKLDVDANKEVATRYGIQAIPTLLFIKGGQEVDRIVGRADKRSLTSKLEALL
jgi:thioredoxin 1